MVIANQDRPLIPRLPMSLRPACSAGGHFRADFGPSEGIGAGIHRVHQNRQDRVIERKLPIDLMILLVVADRGQCDLFLSTPEQYLASAAEFLEFPEYQVNSVLHAQVGIELDRVG